MNQIVRCAIGEEQWKLFLVCNSHSANLSVVPANTPAPFVRTKIIWKLGRIRGYMDCIR